MRLILIVINVGFRLEIELKSNVFYIFYWFIFNISFCCYFFVNFFLGDCFDKFIFLILNIEEINFKGKNEMRELE